ncbi:hypothetical protein [Paenibacillus terrigena]|uniref:hypothetical protein n=1 Tax=Paenibacillus terrigena TaxID=369333 RepID=UPI00039AFA62|nr:hypothetical protein [Paenibacillus terrigena]
MGKNELIASIAKEFKLGCRNNLEILLLSYDKEGDESKAWAIPSAATILTRSNGE